MRKGVTPVVATVLLISVTVASAGTLYTLVEDAQNNAKTSSNEINFQEGDFRMESCWISNSKPKMQLRNYGTDAANVSTITPVIDGVIAENYSISKEIVDPQETFRLSFDQPVYRSSRIQLAGPGSNKDLGCSKFPIDKPKLEAGSIQISDTIDNGASETVEFENFYFNAAAVLFIGSDSGTGETDARVQELNRENMSLILENANGGSSPTETVNYLVAREGAYEINGVKFESRKTELNSSAVHRKDDGIGNYQGKKVEFKQDFSNPPTLFHSLNSYNNGNFMTTAVSGPDSDCQEIDCKPTKEGFDLEQEAADTGNTAAREEAGWIAVEEANRFEIEGLNAETGAFSDSSEDGLSQPRHTISYQQEYSQPPITIADGYSASGPDGYWTRTDGTQSKDTIEIYAQESYDDYHQNEVFSYISFEQEFTYP
ncbi:archaellin/type IV pilin N-terminal domain-containing protein [Candidatus Nanohalobium constans]|uniref:Archaeal flagellin (Archaellin), FlaG/FlaF family n=1 Tax=Candidatus Nanohalobium constans TaxID=2565781 RepID=A0A5Q0UEF1_9ARCH|nr:archaellin/type IV pilin N-terminal domain-containing protein [Candidatus Nanohalobium constans]QGA79953.1 Archaeal flagellin (archaellin), FlaG/FlaF family [Candidatus Nanohalobium constans]